MFACLLSDKEPVSSIWEQLLTETQRALMALASSVLAGELNAIAHYAHTINKAAAKVNAEELSQKAADLEQAAKIGNLAQIPERFRDLQAAWEHLSPSLRAGLDQGT